MKTALLIIVLGAILAAALFGLVTGFDGASITTGGWIAMGLGTFVAFALAIGLMGLAFYSSRHGYDDKVGHDPTHEPADQD